MRWLTPLLPPSLCFILFRAGELLDLFPRRGILLAATLIVEPCLYHYKRLSN